MRRGGLRIAILLSGAALPVLLSTAAMGAPALPGAPVTVPTVTVPTVPTAVTVPTVPTVTVPTAVTVPATPTVAAPVTVPQLPTVTVPTIPTVTIPALPTVTVPTIPTTDATPTKVGAAGMISNDAPASSTGASSSTSTATNDAPRSTDPDSARTITTGSQHAAHRPPTLLAATRQAAAPFALPLALMLLLAAWMVVRGMHDRRDLRLAAAPVADRWVRFR